MAEPLRRHGAVLGLWCLLCVVTNLPYARAWLLPPRGTSFVGFFYAIPDVYNYLSYAQQAQDGALLFVNKLHPLPHAASLANIEWTMVGWLSALLGSRPALAYRFFGAAVLLALLHVSDRWLREGGLDSRHRFPALLLVFTGGGLGGLLFRQFGPPAWRFLDLTTGLYPFISVLVNPHFVAGTALLMWSLWALHRARDVRAEAVGIVLGSCLVLVRPYELALLLGIRVVVVLLTEPRPFWARRLLPLLFLLPACAYGWWTLVHNPAYAVFSAVGYDLPPVPSIGLALLPAGLIALVFAPSLARRVSSPEERAAIVTLFAWVLIAVAILGLPVRFGLQASVNVGLPLLGLTALALNRLGRAFTLLAALAMSSTAMIALGLLLEDNPRWYVPAERLAAARSLDRHCRPGDIAVAPADVGLYVNAYSACHAWVAHLGAPRADERAAEVDRFYAAEPSARAAWLDRHCVRFVLLTDDGPRADGLLGAGAPYERLAPPAGTRSGAIAFYGRDRSARCDDP